MPIRPGKELGIAAPDPAPVDDPSRKNVLDMRQGDMETEMDPETLIGWILCSLLMVIKMRLVSGVDVMVDKPAATFVVGYLLLSL